MLRTAQRCMDLLSSLDATRTSEEYSDTLMDIVINVKYAVERSIKDGSLSEEALLCCHQIITCLKFMEKDTSQDLEVRNYFETRIRFCLSELQNPSAEPALALPDSVLAAMDLAIETLESSETERISVPEIIDAIDRLLSQVLFFRSVILPDDQKKVHEMCRVVLSKKFELKNHLQDESNCAQRRSLTVDLKRSVMELEQLLNHCILRLFVSVMVAVDDDPFACQSTDESDFDLLMDRLIQLGIIAIGFTESGSVKLALRSAVASLESLDLHLVPVLLKCQQLASADAADDEGAVMEASSSSGDTLRRTLVRHWREETAKLSINIHKIIDTKAFSACLIERISELLNRNELLAQATTTAKSEKLEMSSLDGILKMLLVFHQHLCLNGIGIGGGGGIVADEDVARTGKDFLLELHHKDMKIMLNECKAVLKYAEQVEAPRIFKRFRLLLHILEKIRRDLPNEEQSGAGDCVGDADNGENSTLKAISEMRGEKTHMEGWQHVSKSGKGGERPGDGGEDDDDEGATEYFMSFGISMASTSRIFYRKQQRVKKSEGPSMIPQLSTVLRHQSRWQRTRRPHRLFREGPSAAAKIDSSSAAAAVGVEESLQLNITEILEQLTKFSETFSN